MKLPAQGQEVYVLAKRLERVKSKIIIVVLPKCVGERSGHFRLGSTAQPDGQRTDVRR
jgi:hypothetical protein